VAHPRHRQCEGREEGGVGGGTNRAGQGSRCVGLEFDAAPPNPKAERLLNPRLAEPGPRASELGSRLQPQSKPPRLVPEPNRVDLLQPCGVHRWTRSGPARQ
jgi:hypothetical protein